MSNRILVVTQQGEARFLTTESAPTRVITIQPTGARGIPGTTGAGVAAGGSANDILKKTSGTNYATEWETPTSAATANTIVRRDETGGAFFGGDVGAPKYRGNNYQAESANDGASLRNSAGTAILTWGATGQNMTVTAGTAVTFNATSYTYGTGAAAAHRTALELTALATTTPGTGVATLLTGTPSGNDGPVGKTSPTITNLGVDRITISGNINSAAWTTAGIRIKGNPATLTDTTSTGTVAAAYTDAFGGNTIAASNSTTYTNYTTAFFREPTAGTNVTMTNKYALGAESARFGTSNQLTISTSGVLTATSPVFTTPALGTPSSGTLTNATGLPISTGVSGLGTGVATLLAGTPSGTGGLVGKTSPTLTTPTISRGSTGQVFVAQDVNAAACNLTTDASGRAFFNIVGYPGAASQAGAYMSMTGYEEAWANVIALSNTTGKRYMRFGNLSNRFSIQLLNDAGTAITSTPFSFANESPSNSFYMNASGGVTIGGTTDAGATNLLVAGTVKANGGFIYGTYTVGTFPATTYLEAIVTDALAPAIGATVTAGGSAKCKVMYNGSAKIVTAVL